MSAALEARRAAAAVDADFARACGEHVYGQLFDWGMWAGRLSTALRSLLDLLETGAGPGAPITPHQREVLGQAIADALMYRDPAVPCTACDEDPAGICDEHAADLDRTDAYLTLARDLGVEMDGGGELND